MLNKLLFKLFCNIQLIFLKISYDEVIFDNSNNILYSKLRLLLQRVIWIIVIIFLPMNSNFNYYKQVLSCKLPQTDFNLIV